MREPARTALAENVLLVQHITRGDRLQRVLAAPQMRFSAHNVQGREYVLAPPTGIRVLAPDERATGVRKHPLEPEGSSAGGDTPAQGERRDAHGPGGVPHPDRGG